MRIKEILSQYRRDFKALYECEHCQHVTKGSGYDDDNFHQYVIPAMECKQCGKSAPEDYVAEQTKYPEGMQI